MTEQKYTIFINRKIINKPSEEDLKKNHNNWEIMEVTFDELTRMIHDCGYAFVPGFFKGNKRKKKFWQGADLLVLDIDDGDLEETLKNPLLIKYRAFLYTTPSHDKDGKDKYRLIFKLPERMTDMQEYESLIKGLASKFSGVDSKCFQAACMYYGSQGCFQHDFGGDNQ